MGVVIGGGCEVEMWADEGRGWGHDGWAMHMVSYKQGVPKIKKMHLGFQFFFSRLSLNQPANVIRHISILGNMMSSPCYFPSPPSP
jgi:hypothetical protein